jgi:eukaryotic-like serine/threonine-protein kinase
MKLAEPKLRDYQLQRELGRGGTAIVYQAIETSIARQVAIKILPAAATLDERQTSRFRLEAQVAASLDHPRIVPVYTVGSDDQVVFYVMKFIDGRSLADVVDEMRLTRTDSDELHIGNVAKWGLQASEALSYAHALGVVHGDVKPANLLLDQSGDLWLTDFGAARLSAPQPHSTELAPAGTIRYLSPELVRGEPSNIDHRCDIYALGATLFELATLRPAFEGDNSGELLKQIAVGTPPRLAAWNTKIPARFREIILRAMAADLNTRYATADEMAEDLRCFLQNQSNSAGSIRFKRDPSFVRRKRIFVALAGILALALGLTSLSYIARRSVAFNPIQHAAVGQDAYQRLRALTEQSLNQTADKSARGISLAAAESQLMQFGPSTDLLFGSKEIEYQEQARYQLAKVYDCLATLHGWKHDFAMQEAMLTRSKEQWAALIEQHPFPPYVASSAFSQLMMGELYAQTGRILESVELSRAAIRQLETMHKAKPEDFEMAVALAYALTRLDLTLAEMLPPDELERHRHFVFNMLESLPQQSDEMQSKFGGSFGHPDSLQLPFTSLRDALAECRVNLAFLVPDLRQAEQYLRTAIADLADAEVTDSVAGRRVSLLARAEQLLGKRLSEADAARRAEAETYLGQAAALFQQLSAEFPPIVAYRAGLATTLSEFGASQASTTHGEVGRLKMTQGADLLRELVAEFPDDAEFHHRLAGTLNDLGNNLSGAEALAYYEEAVQHESIAIRFGPRHREQRRWLAIQYGNLANSYWQAKNLDRAESIWRLAIENAAYLSELEPAGYDNQHRLAHNWLGLGECLSVADKDEQEATDAFRTATDLFRSLFQESGRKPHDACMLAASYAIWSQLLEKQGDLDQARQALERAIAHEQEALDLEPDQAEHNSSLAEYHLRFEKLSQ